jgi:hypothetical protein
MACGSCATQPGCVYVWPEAMALGNNGNIEAIISAIIMKIMAI